MSQSEELLQPPSVSLYEWLTFTFDKYHYVVDLNAVSGAVTRTGHIYRTPFFSLLFLLFLHFRPNRTLSSYIIMVIYKKGRTR